MSALRSSAGPEVVTMFTPISRAMMLARVVLPRPGRSGQQNVVERLAPRLRRRDEYAQLLAKHRLAHESAERTRAQGALELLLERSLLGVCQSLVFGRHASAAPSACQR